MKSLKHFYVGVKGVIFNPLTNKVLVLNKIDQSGQSFWDIPGGRIDDQERILQTLERELKEEITNIKDFKIKNLLNAYRLSKDLNDGLGLLLLFYKIEANLDEIKLSQEHKTYRWIDQTELKTLNTPQTHIEDGYLKALELAFK